MVSVLTTEETRLVDVVRTAGYILIALLNAFVIVVLAGSRGPQLGWLAGSFFAVLLFAQLLRRKKLRLGLTLGWIGLGVVAGALLVLLNTSDAPVFDRLRQLPVLNRLSTAFKFDEGTNAVRSLIWQGALNLATPHDAISFPDGTSDRFNIIRPLIGYGPESMYVAYNRYYPPDLAHFEARNASPDRSHNETWDALVITGLIGFLAYMLLFGSYFYYGFKWIGLVGSKFERILFPLLLILGGAISVVVFAAAVGWHALGVGVAFGVAAGLILYLIVSALINVFGKDEGTLRVNLSLRDQVMLIALVSAVMAHFIEIHLGIAIASTRTLFWAFTAMTLVLGMGWLDDSKRPASEAQVEGTEAVAEPAPADPPGAAGARPATAKSPATKPAGAAKPRPSSTGATRTTRSQRRVQQQAGSERRSSRGFLLPGWFNAVAVSGLFLGLILGILAFDFITNADRNTVVGRVFFDALTVVRGEPAYGVLGMVAITWILGAVLLVGDAHRSGTLGIPATNNLKPLAAALALCLSVSALVCVAFGTFVAGRLVDFVSARQNTVDTILGIAQQLAAFPAYLYVLIGIVMVLSAFLLRREEPVTVTKAMTPTGLAVLLVALPVGLWTMSTSNLQPIAADIVYKQAAPWDQQGAAILQPGTNVQGWDVAIEHYRKAIQLAPNEDFYYLWLGRALLEKAKTTQNVEALRSWPEDVPFTKVIDDGLQNWNRLPNSLPSAMMSREDLLTAARVILSEARVINPLNTDHSANLARMWRQAGDIATDPAVKQQRYDTSSKEYATATTLSPNNAQLWNEWASLYLYSLNDPAIGQAKLEHSLSIDDRFDQTYLLRGELLMQEAQQIDQQRLQAAQLLASIPATDTAKLEEAKAAQQAADDAFRAKLREARVQFTGAISANLDALQAYNVVTYIDQQLGDLTSAISVTLALLDRSPADWTGYKNLALLYRDANQPDLAREAARRAIELAPQDQQAGLQSLLDQLALPKP